MARCADADPATRKFACFALGNAAFHSDTLYSRLEAGIAPLVALLRDSNPKTRLNAVGALGNMVRSGEQLVPRLLQAGAVKVRLASGSMSRTSPYQSSCMPCNSHSDKA